MKVAVLISGVYKNATDPIVELLDWLRSHDNYEVDTYIHAWWDKSYVGKRYRINHLSVVEDDPSEAIKARIQPKKFLLEPQAPIDFTDMPLMDEGGGTHLQREIAIFSLISQAKSLQRCYKLIDNPNEYDMILRLRGDMFVEDRNYRISISKEELSSNKAWIFDDKSYTGWPFGDWLYLGNPSVMGKFIENQEHAYRLICKTIGKTPHIFKFIPAIFSLTGSEPVAWKFPLNITRDFPMHNKHLLMDTENSDPTIYPFFWNLMDIERLNLKYHIRKSCLFCKSEDLTEILEVDKQISHGCFSTEKDFECHSMPYNVVYCNKCGTVQTKYLGDLNIIYSENFAGAFGTTRNRMNTLFCEFLLKNKNFENVLEIGAGNGEVADIIIEQRKCSYTIVDPSYWGSEKDRDIQKVYFEKWVPTTSMPDTVIMSHVFEHFYDPIAIIRKIVDTPSIKNIYLNFPNLEVFIQNNVYHVLNPEHIYYTENTFLEEVFLYYGFELTARYDYDDYAVFFEFKRVSTHIQRDTFPKNKKTLLATKEFFKKLQKNIKAANKRIETTDKEVYIWPSSMHTTFVISNGLKKKYIKNVLDNSPSKTGKYLYGTQLYCKSFNDVTSTETPKLFLLSASYITKEVMERLQRNPDNEIIVL